MKPQPVTEQAIGVDQPECAEPSAAGRLFESVKQAASRHGPSLLSWALTRAGQPSDAWDLVQDAYERALRKRPRVPASGDLRSWLFAVIKNRHIDRCRTPAMRSLVDFDIDTVQASDPREIAIWRRVDPKAVLSAMSRLPANLREPLMLRMAGHQCREVAKRLSLRPAIVSARVFRARRQLRETLERELGQDMMEARRTNRAGRRCREARAQ
jgi:RNA polymerase sigma-70 factor, ECF subfamily